MTALNIIHKDDINSAVASYHMNVVLGGSPQHRGREKYATENKNDFDTSKVGIEQHDEFFA